MKKRLIATFALTAATIVLLPHSGSSVAAFEPQSPSSAKAGDDKAVQATQDIVHMRDGRVLHGQILEETRTSVKFEYHDRNLNIKTVLTLAKDEIIKMDRDQPLELPAEEAKSDDSTSSAGSSSAGGGKTNIDSYIQSYGATRMKTEDPAVPSIYMVPMKGQMGTDVISDVYKKVAEDIKAKKPDLVVITMDCQDQEDVLYSMKGKDEMGLADMDDFRQLVNVFRDDLRQFKQVVWIHDSQGMSSTVALAWSDIYMKPNARLGGLVSALEQTGFEGWSDDDVRGKMTAAFMAWIQGFLESGGYPRVLADAMVRPRFKLSASWEGREVEWQADTDGQYIVDESEERTANFRARDAENLLISDGTAETLDDLALLRGYREYRLADGMGEKYLEGYVQDWRRAYEDCKTQFLDYEQYMGWATGQDTVKYLGRAKSALEKVVAYIERYKAVETRLARDFGVRKNDLIIDIEIIKERLRALQNNRGGGGGVRGGGGRAGGGGRGGEQP